MVVKFDQLKAEHKGKQTIAEYLFILFYFVEVFIFWKYREKDENRSEHCANVSKEFILSSYFFPILKDLSLKR